MAYVSEFDFDLFVSYARIDDEADFPSDTNWVTTFVAYLTTALRKRLGGTEELKVFFDRSEMKSNNELSELKRAAQTSALFLCVCSRSYSARSWTREELAAFSIQPDSSKRIFAIEIMPLDQGDRYPDVLEDRHREPFFTRTDKMGGTIVPIKQSDPRFGHLIHDLAEDIRNQLYAMRAVRDVKALTASLELKRGTINGARKASSRGQVVFLGQATDDLAFQSDQLRRYLEQYGHTLKPETDLRQDTLGFEEDTGLGLEEATLFVQLLGPYAGRSPADMVGSYAKCQYDIATSRGVPTVRWRSPDLDMEAIADPDHKEALTGEGIIVSGFESFKAEVNDRLAKLSSKAEPVHAETEPDGSLPVIFINADLSDLDYARKVRDEFARNGFLASIPLDRGEETDLQSYLRENLIECDGLVMIYGNTSPIWATRNLRHFNKLRSKRQVPPRLVAVLVGPPDGKASDLGVSMPGLRVMGSTEAWQENTIEELIEAFSS
ncbi:toll/interleukin-1 receptor domain-containing protein [Fodinicurvata halophila]|uniref:Toll/interleukin-1 receptor domain-containing protein n=1 Tax=Fodinicurvata halophila TaxID=1419723 RepID=A0ABV8UPF7_9PROT